MIPVVVATVAYKESTLNKLLIMRIMNEMWQIHTTCFFDDTIFGFHIVFEICEQRILSHFRNKRVISCNCLIIVRSRESSRAGHNSASVITSHRVRQRRKSLFADARVSPGNRALSERNVCTICGTNCTWNSKHSIYICNFLDLLCRWWWRHCDVKQPARQIVNFIVNSKNSK